MRIILIYSCAYVYDKSIVECRAWNLWCQSLFRWRGTNLKFIFFRQFYILSSSFWVVPLGWFSTNLLVMLLWVFFFCDLLLLWHFFWPLFLGKKLAFVLEENSFSSVNLAKISNFLGNFFQNFYHNFRGSKIYPVLVNYHNIRIKKKKLIDVVSSK